MENIGFYWDMGAHVYHIAEMVVIGCLLYRFAKPFLNENKYAAAVGFTYFIVIIILYLSFNILHIQGATADAIAIAAVFAAMCFIDRRNIRQKVFLTVIMYMIMGIASEIESVIIVRLHHVVLDPHFVAARPVLQTVLYLLMVPVNVGLIYVIMASLFHIVDKTYTYKREDMQSRELKLALVPLLTVTAGYLVLSFFSNLYLADMGQYIWYPHPEFLWIRFLYYLISFAAVMAVMVIYQSIRNSYMQEKENAVLAEQMEQTRRNIKEIERLHQDVYRLRHDMGNHVTVLENLLLLNEPQETEKYLSRLKEQLNEITPGIKSGNPVTDIILAEKQREAREMGIDFQCDFHYPPKARIDAFDVSIVLNNALSNAIEGAVESRNPYVSISSYCEKNAYIIEIQNSFSKELKIDERSGLPESTKTDKENHGYGMINIRKVAQKYLGDIEIEQDEHDFLLRIMLMLE